MSLELLTSPEKTVNGLLSNPNAAISQLPYTFQREDYETGTVFNNSGQAEVFIFDYSPGFFSVGDAVFYRSDNGTYNAIYTVTAVNDGQARITLNTPYIDDGGVPRGYVNNLTTRPGYKIEIQVLDELEAPLFPITFKYSPKNNGFAFVDLGSIMTDYMRIFLLNSALYAIEYREIWRGQLHETISIEFPSVDTRAGNVELISADNTGDLTDELELGEVIRVEFLTGSYPSGDYAITNLLYSAGNDRTFVAIDLAFVDFVGSGFYHYNVKYPSYRTDTIQAVLAKKQQGLQGGSNLWEHLLREGVANSLADETRIISQITENVPDAISVFTTSIADYTTGDIVYVRTFDNFYNAVGAVGGIGGSSMRVEIPYKGDVLGGNVGEISPSKGNLLTKFKEPLLWRGWKRTAASLIDSDYVNRTGGATVGFTVRNNDINKQPLDIASLDTGTDTTPRVFETILPEPSPAAAYFSIFGRGLNQPVQFTKELFYQVLEPCPFPVMIEWLNSLGTWEQHLFSINQELNLEASPGIIYETPVSTDLEEVHGNKGRINIETTQTMLLVAQGLSNRFLEALAEIKTSETVRAWLTQDGEEFVQVVTRVELGTPYQSRDDRGEFRLVIEFPQDFNFYEAKKY